MWSLARIFKKLFGTKAKPAGSVPKAPVENPKPSTFAQQAQQIVASSSSNFTQEAQQVLALSRHEANRFNHNFVGTEHLLLAITALGQGTAAGILKKIGPGLDVIRNEIDSLIGTGPGEKNIGSVPYTPRVKKVLALAAKEAREMNHAEVGTGHILLGLMREGDGVAPRVLKRLDIDIEPVIAEVRQRYASGQDMENKPKESLPWPPPTAEVGPIADVGNFTPRAQQVLMLARKEADRLNHNFVGTEHVLIGLIRLGQGVAVNVLGKLGVSLENVRTEVEALVGRGPDQKMIGDIPYTPRVKKVLALAARQATALKHTYVGTEHILLGLLEEGDGVAARVLKKLDLNVKELRKEILRELDPNLE